MVLVGFGMCRGLAVPERHKNGFVRQGVCGRSFRVRGRGPGSNPVDANGSRGQGVHSLRPFHTADSLHAVHVDGRPLSRGAAGQAPRGLGPRACARGGAGRRCLRPGRLSPSKPGGRRFKSCPRDQKHRSERLSALTFFFSDPFVCRFVCRLRRRFCLRGPVLARRVTFFGEGDGGGLPRPRCRFWCRQPRFES